jgi:hypothetical protein
MPFELRILRRRSNPYRAAGNAAEGREAALTIISWASQAVSTPLGDRPIPLLHGDHEMLERPKLSATTGPHDRMRASMFSSISLLPEHATIACFLSLA